jgi:nucleoredoxin
MSQFASLLGDKLLDGKEEVSTADRLAEADVVMIYFSAHWCPPCRGFTPTLASAYTSKTNPNSYIIFASSDQDSSAFDSYYSSMPWLAIPYSSRSIKDKLSELYGVRGIPTLVVLDKNGKVITKEGRSEFGKYLGGGGGGDGGDSGGGCVIL